VFTKSTTLIIPTKDRPKYLFKTLNFLNERNIKFKKILVIDSSSYDNRQKINKYIRKYKVKLIYSSPSTSRQRNIGLRNVKKTKFIMFLDDDIKFKKNSFKKMDEGIKQFKNSSGYCFNIINKERNNFINFLKKSKIISMLNLYSEKKGIVLKNGWHTQFFNCDNNIDVEWMYSGATIFKFDKIKNMKFKVSKYSYCYLEDLDFTYNLFKKKLKLTCIYKAKIFNNNISERNSFEFGKIEISNRFDFVKKYKLKKSLFFLSSFIKIILNFLNVFKLNIKILPRVLGNFYGFIYSLKLLKKK
jgi:hypothetical protein